MAVIHKRTDEDEHVSSHDGSDERPHKTETENHAATILVLLAFDEGQVKVLGEEGFPKVIIKQPVNKTKKTFKYSYPSQKEYIYYNSPE